MRVVVLMCASCIGLLGCTSWQLKRSTLTVSSSIGSILEQQVLANLAQAYEHPYSIPSQAVLSQGVIQVQNSATASMKLPYTLTRSADKEVDPGMTFQWQETWTIVPVMDAADAARLEYLYVSATAPLPRKSATTKAVGAAPASEPASGVELRKLMSFGVYQSFNTDRTSYGQVTGQGCVDPTSTSANETASIELSTSSAPAPKQPPYDRYQDCKLIVALLSKATDWLEIDPENPPATSADLDGFVSKGTAGGHKIYVKPREFAQFVMFVLDAAPNSQNASGSKGLSLAIQ